MPNTEGRQDYLDLPGYQRIGVFSEELHKSVELAKQFHADRRIPVLVEGDAGTGKEFIALLVHHGDEEDSAPFIRVNCSAIAPSLFESELFGYEAGASAGTGNAGAKGKLEQAQGGTLFLDEVGDIPMNLQPKLLRVLEEGEMHRVGGDKPIKLDVRIICSTNWDLRVLVEEARFRLDLYHKLNKGKITVPPLWRQKEAIVPLAKMFVAKFSMELKRDFQAISDEAATILERYPWPGNIRELRNTMERVVLLYNDDTVQPQHLGFLNQSMQVDVPRNEIGLLRPGQVVLPEADFDLQEVMEEVIIKAVDKFEGNRNKAAQFLGLSWNTLNNRLKRIS